MTNPELKFRIKVLEDVVEASDLVLNFSDFKKNDREAVEERRKRYVAEEMIRRFKGTLEGRKMHMRQTALILCSMVTSEN
jgi:hypothetical protein